MSAKNVFDSMNNPKSKGKLDRKIYAEISTNKLASMKDDWRILMEHRAYEPL